MSEFNFCCLCASDEGVFLDIFTATDRQLGNRSFPEEFETCLSVKVKQDEALSTKICHRCAIELGQCNQFVEKYYQVYEATLKLKKAASKKTCCLCLSTVKNNFLFTLAKDFRSTVDPLQKIYECFNRQITREQAESRSICLLCRYNLDVLYDLKKLAGEVKSKLQRIAKNRVVLESLPKTVTFVVNRKTTTICQSKIEFENLSESGSECDRMARKQSKSKKVEDLKSAMELKLRTCGQCHTSIEGGIDMYRLHSTGVTVCKMCWITMDPFNPSRGNKRKRKNQAEGKNTRLCAVFLKDVLSPATSKDEVPSKVRKNRIAEPIYVISDTSSNDGEKTDARSKKNLRNRRGKKVSESDEEYGTNLRTRSKRSLKQEEVNADSRSNKKLRSIKNDATTVSSSLRRSSRYQSSDSDSTRAKNKRSHAADVKNDVANKVKSLPKVNYVHSDEKVSKIKPTKNYGKRKWINADPVESKSAESAASGDDGVGPKARKVRNKVPLILKPKLPDNPKSAKSMKPVESRTAAPSKSPTVSKNSRLQSLDKNQRSKIKLPSKKSKALMMVSFPFKLRDPYECKVCRTTYKNKIVGMKHELTHFKQVEIKIEKLNITHHFQTINQNSPTSDLPDVTCSIDLPSTNEKPLQPEVPTPTSPLESKEDEVKGTDQETEKGESIRQAEESESTQQNDKSPDVDSVKEKAAVSSANELLAEESTSILDDTKSKTEENVAPELPAETTDGLNKGDEPSAKVDSATGTDTIDNDNTIIISNKSIDEDEREKLAEELETTIITGEEKKSAENRSNEEIVSPQLETVTDKDIEKDEDSGEELESDTDIRIIDSGSSAEESSERTVKHTTDTKIVNNVSAGKDTDDKQIDTKEESKPNDESEETLKNKPEADNTPTIVLDNNLDTETKSNGESSQNEQENQKDCEESELNKEIEEDVQPLNVVTEIMQEVIDLATAEVQKRVESDVTSVPETLENISEEIKKSAEGSPAIDEILASVDAATNKDTDLFQSDFNSTTNSLKNHLEVSATDA